ncbi:uncharacterized protein (DUF305 family) [Allocatelliglobosispora scoriae]|uniref:Uncharacterized protein (DUF305 family) n=1 Tax=Allocatelliglobosispora scoriae TaxID=643052 RepID=A0A841BL68_9ACTN|nr:DUF305 domain-containing protein [Allocatelliglobosispora scoriae]MBB5869034.1 uncharacterized protein (DUF305 family) [Allocatelliglobosispora scoriae]
MRFKLLAGLALIAALAPGCASPAPAPTATASTAAPVAVAGGTDLAWTQLTLALDEHALQILELAPERAADAKLKAFAAEVAAAHRDEAAELKRMLVEIQAPPGNPHEGHVMPGMVTPEALAAMRASSGAAFDALLTTSLREHLSQCLSLAKSEQKAGSQPAVKALAMAIEKDRGSALERLTALTPR